MSQEGSLSNSIQKCDRSICEMHEISKTELSAIHIQTRHDSLFATYRLPDTGKASRIAQVDDKRVFLGASLFKPLIATGVARMINHLSTSSEEDCKRYRHLEGAWEMTFTEVFNKHSDVKMQRLEGDPSIKQLMVHFKGPYDVNHILFSPDGSTLISEDDFRDTISQFTEQTREQHDRGEVWATYSNGNYILLSLLIQVVSKMPLRDFLRQYVFDPLGMKNTYMATNELKKLADGLLAKPHTVSGSGVRHPITFNRIPFLEDTVEVAVAGGYISAADLGRFFKVLVRALFYEPEIPWFDKDFATFLLEIQPYGFTPCGLSMNLHERFPGSHSPSRIISPESQYLDYVLGKRQEKGEEKEIRAWYLAGAATGWASTAYLLPDLEVSIIVLTNTSSPTDISDHISRLCLHEILELPPAKYENGELRLCSLGPEKMPPDERSRAHFVELMRGMDIECSLEVRRVHAENVLPPDTRVEDCPKVCGTYINRTTKQSLEVTEVGGVLRVKLTCSKESGLMRFVWKDQVFRICSFLKNNPSCIPLDNFRAWRNMVFQIEKTDDLVKTLIRVSLNCTDRFERK